MSHRRPAAVSAPRSSLARALGLVIALSAVAVVPGTAAGATCAYSASWSAPDAGAADAVIDLVNAHRAGLGLSPLGTASVLERAAEWKSGHMAANGYFAHEDVGITVGGRPRTFGQRAADCGVPGGAGENIAAGQRSPAEVMRGWLDSPGHRQNIERAGYRSIGVGVVTSPGGRINWTQIFSTDGSIVDGGGAPPPPRPPSPAPPPAPAPAPAPAPSPAPSPAPATVPPETTPRPAAPGADVLRPGSTMRARRGMRPGGRRALRFRLDSPAVARVAVKVRDRRGRRPVVVRLRCNGRTLEADRGRRGRLVLMTTRLPAGECRVVVRAGRQKVAVAILARSIPASAVARSAPARPDQPPAAG